MAYRWTELAEKYTEPELLAIYLAEEGKVLTEKQIASGPQGRCDNIAYRIWSARQDPLGYRAMPREGFEMPREGDRVVAVAPYQLLREGYKDYTKTVIWNGLLEAGAEGTVTEIRAPGTKFVGYVGLCVEWDKPKVLEGYPAHLGFVIRWDVASDPTKFKIVRRS